MSLAAREPVATYLHDRLINSAFLVFLAGIISIPISIAIGAYAALRRDGVFDTTSSVGTLLLAALPEFVLGVTLVVVFATTVFPHLLPGVSYLAPGSRPWDHLEEMILPTLTLVLAVTPYVARIMRASMIEVLESDYVEMARLKGVPERLVITRHALPNALGPTFQVIAINLAYLAGGVIVVEYVFNYAGIGRALQDAVSTQDLPVVQALAMLIAGPLRRAEPAGGHRHDPRHAEAADAPVSVAEVAAFSPEPDVVVARAPAGAVFRTALRMWRTRIGLLLVVILVLVAIVGPLFAPFSPTDFVGVAPNSPPGGKALFGTDHIGQDVWSRFLWGGREILVMAVLATVIGLVLGSAIGLTAAYARNALDDVLMRAMDVILAFPQIMLALVVIATVGPKAWLLVAAVGLTTMPRVARVTRGAAQPIVERDFVAAAEALGLPRARILLREVLPNILSPLLVEANLRLTYSIGIIASLAFLGFTPNPNGADWGLMIQENQLALGTNQPWGVVLPMLAIALLTVGTGLVGDGFARAAAGIDRGKAAE